MIASRGLGWSGSVIKNGPHRLATVPIQARSFSNTVNKPSLLRPQRPRQSRSLSGLPSAQQHRSLSLFGWGSSSKPSSEFGVPEATPSKNVIDTWDIKPPNVDPSRSFKASHATSDTPDPSASSSIHPSTPEPKILHDLENAIASPYPPTAPDTSLLSDETDLSTIPEAIGYLKNTCGLDYGWGPTATLEVVLEHLHITGGLSWALSIPVLALLCRIVIFRFTLGASDTTAKMREVAPILKPLRAEYLEAAKAGDNVRVAQIRAEMQAINAEYGVSFWAAFKPLLIQIPLQYGGFRLLRGMSALPVPAFEKESWLWTTDLTAGDPYLILPVLSSCIIYANLRFGMAQQTGPVSGVDTQKIILYVLPIINLGFMWIQPGAVQLFFVTSTFLGMSQTALLKWPWIRSRLGLHPLPPPQPKDATISTTTPGGMTRHQSTVVLNGQLETPSEVPVNRSFIDKMVDGATQRRKFLVDGFKSTTNGIMGTSIEERGKKTSVAKAEEYEAKRRREMDIERESRNLRELGAMDRASPASRQVSVSGGGQGSGSKVVDDVFEHEEVRSAARTSKEGKQRKKGKSRP